MPHLSPMKWALMSIVFMLLMLSFSALNWWTQLPMIKSNFKSKKEFPLWKW